MEDQDRQQLAAFESKLRALTARLNALAEGNFEINAEGFRIGSTRLFEKLVGSLYHLHQRDAAGTENDLTDALSIMGVDISTTAPTAAQVLVYDATLDEWTPASSSTPGAHALGGAAHTADTLANLNTKVSDATLDDSGDSRTPSAHNIASHSDTTATGTELETLTDGSDADALHDHTQFASAAEAIAAVEGEATLDLTGDVTIDGAKSLSVDVINEKDADAGVTIDVKTLIKDKIIYPDKDYSASYFKASDTLVGFGLDTQDYIAYNKGTNLYALVLGDVTKFSVSPTQFTCVPNADFSGGVDVTGNITVTGTVDGVDIAARDHAEAHTVVSHSDTTITGAETETLSDGSNADSLHLHGETNIDSTPADDSATGIKTEFTAGTNLVWGDFCYIGADGKMEKALATAEATSRVVAFCTETIAENSAGTFLLHGFIRDDSAYDFTMGAKIYLSDDTAGAHDETQPAGADECIVILGVALTADVLYFNPQVQSIVEHTGA